MIGILGGTFDPVHYGHLRPTQEVQHALGMKRVYVVPAGEPPHRPPPVASAEQRLRMAELAFAGLPGFCVDDREIRRPGPSYSVFTLESLRREFEHRPLCLIIGIDAFLDLETWHQWQRIPELAHLVVMERPDRPAHARGGGAFPAWVGKRVAADPGELARSRAGLIRFQQVTPQPISASRIRAAIAAGVSAERWLPPAVREYIRDNGLYRPRGSDAD